ncbi:ECF transporter S component [Clostridium sp. CX1]|uniref:ECF transporter S component n=1 Tax=Clostridium tanneri TaxID=3037988 RepID=A0ABU4JQF6_9CLOT|nr:MULTISPECIES: ECF transporter S component [unclassified Clostridium]MCT8977647.1 ECF transporter S component [Clostridium sp. CX1]MDW8800390.1 ECF transporter S component [Clostridium sp. A1-XYC3]
MKNIKKLTYSGLLTALAIIIPLAFGFLKVQAGPFSATLASHVPMFVAMLLGPFAAVMVGVGSALGFLISAPAVIAARAFMHTFVGLVGALLLKKGVSFSKVVAITAPVHAILEAIAVIPFGFTMYKVLVVVGVGTFLHHMVDGVIAFALIKSLSKSLKLDLRKVTT